MSNNNLDIEPFEFKWDLKKDFKPREIMFVNLLCDYSYSVERAYRDAYKLKPEQAAKNAWVLYRQDKIQDLLRIRRQELLLNANINFQTQIQKLEEIRQLAMSKGNLKDAMKAIELINSMLGWSVHKIDVKNENKETITINYVNPEKPEIEDIKTIDVTNINDKKE